MSRLDAPSQHPIPDGVPDPATWHLLIDGLVEHATSLSLADLQRFAEASHEGAFTCVRGWEAGSDRWEGPPLESVLALAVPLAPANALYAYAAGFRSLVPLEAVPNALLAVRLDGQPLTTARGAPCRLVVADPSCELSLKWLKRLELIHRQPDEPVGPRRP